MMSFARVPATPTTNGISQTGTLVGTVYETVADLPLSAGNGTLALVSDGVTATLYAYVRPTGWIAL